MAIEAWTVEYSQGAAKPFHDRDLRHLAEPTALIHSVTTPALVLGSRQQPDLLGSLPPEIEVCNRRSGGGLVVLEPNRSLWIDVVLPRAHPLWDDDVNRSFHWVGETWQRALNDVGVPQTRVHKGALLRRDHGAVLCFAGLGPGEITVGPYNHKIVGLSQRRTKEHARFQCLAVLGWSPKLLAEVINPTALPDDLAIDALRIGFPNPEIVPQREQLSAAFLHHLP